MCPRCGQNAPLLYRGAAAYCSACGAQRLPLADTSLNAAGRTAKIGGAIASTAGWVVLFGGLAIALAVGLIAHALWPAGFVGLALGIPIAVVSLASAWALLRSGSVLSARGLSAARNARAQAVFALAANRAGRLTARDVARALDVPVGEADALLTSLANESAVHDGQATQVTVEIDSEGGIYYRFGSPSARLRVESGPLESGPEDASASRRDPQREWEELGPQETEEGARRARGVR